MNMTGDKTPGLSVREFLGRINWLIHGLESQTEEKEESELSMGTFALHPDCDVVRPGP